MLLENFSNTGVALKALLISSAATYSGHKTEKEKNKTHVQVHVAS